MFFAPVAWSHMQLSERLESLGIMGGLIEGLPENPQMSQHYGTEGFKRGSHYGEKR